MKTISAISAITGCFLYCFGYFIPAAILIAVYFGICVKIDKNETIPH